MKLLEFFRNLSVGPLANLSMAQAGDPSGIDPSKHEGLVLHTNEALTRLHGRFVLREGMMIVEEVEGRTTYPLESKYAMSNYDAGAGHAFFIQDQWGEPYRDDVIKVLEVFDTFGIKLPLNEADQPASLFTPQPRVLQVPHSYAGMALSISYQANHPKIAYTESGSDFTQSVYVPESLSSALSAYVAYKVYSGINSQENAVKAAEYLKMFETICMECLEYDLIGTQSSSSTERFIKRGWM